MVFEYVPTYYRNAFQYDQTFYRYYQEKPAIEVLFCGDNLEPDTSHAQEIHAKIKERMSQGQEGELTLFLLPGQATDTFPAYQMCSGCDHNLCNNETLTGVELQYVTQEMQDGVWVESTDINVSKLPI